MQNLPIIQLSKHNCPPSQSQLRLKPLVELSNTAVKNHTSLRHAFDEEAGLYRYGQQGKHRSSSEHVELAELLRSQFTFSSDKRSGAEDHAARATLQYVLSELAEIWPKHKWSSKPPEQPHTAEFMDLLSGENDVTITSVKPVLNLLTGDVLKPSDEDAALTSNIKRNMCSVLEEKYKTVTADKDQGTGRQNSESGTEGWWVYRGRDEERWSKTS
eukprot:superscaffoldBa00010499_g24741